MWHSNPILAQQSAVVRQWLLVAGPHAIIESQPFLIASAIKNSCFRTLLPVSAAPVRSSRLMKIGNSNPRLVKSQDFIGDRWNSLTKAASTTGSLIPELNRCWCIGQFCFKVGSSNAIRNPFWSVPPDQISRHFSISFIKPVGYNFWTSKPLNINNQMFWKWCHY